jgi:hypothetical protein
VKKEKEQGRKKKKKTSAEKRREVSQSRVCNVPVAFRFALSPIFCHTTASSSKKHNMDGRGRERWVEDIAQPQQHNRKREQEGLNIY